jgi:hypothetical protein
MDVVPAVFRLLEEIVITLPLLPPLISQFFVFPFFFTTDVTPHRNATAMPDRPVFTQTVRCQKNRGKNDAQV